MKKTYCVDGLLEWHVQIPAGRLKIPVEFSGGHLSGYGITPAVFSTSDPVLQKAIELCAYFTSGRIRLLDCSPDNNSRNRIALKPSPQLQVDVPDLNSARQQVARLTNTPLGHLHTRSEIENCAKRHGIKLSISKP